jgi:pterin-4a-carbinolamine dehydratase
LPPSRRTDSRASLTTSQIAATELRIDSALAKTASDTTMVEKALCSEEANFYIDKVHHIVFELPFMAFDAAIDVMNMTAECPDMMNCDPDINAVFKKYPQLDKDMDFLDAIGDPAPYMTF